MNAFSLASGADGSATVALSGDWSIKDRQPSLAPVRDLAASKLQRIAIDASGLGTWDSALLSFIFQLAAFCRDRKIALDDSGLPANARRLIALAFASPPRQSEGEAAVRPNFVRKVGEATLREAKAMREPVRFLGETMLTFVRFVTGRARYRVSDVFLMAQECGAEALPIVGIISLLIGMIFAFVGAIQLRQFGADIYDANLVAVAMFREMGAVMTGIVLTGRTGAAFAAQIGAMQGNEEINSLSTFGISPMEFLVLPRMLALVVMMPLLVLYADVLGLIGGYIVGMGTLNVTSTAYLLQTQSAATITDLTIGVVKGSVFGILIALTGCLRGMKAGRSAAAVGAATTGAVVSGILAIIVTDAIFAVVLDILGL